jgi:glycosyltransferase involved in cell wall biosynthesis
MYKVFYDYGFRNLKIMPALNSFNPHITLPKIEKSTSGVNRILMIFDYKSSFDRKNPIDVVDIIKSLPTNLEFELVIKTINGNDFNNFRKNLINRIEKDPRIIMMEKYMSQEEINKLYMNSDIYISLHRAEGLGLNLLKALQYGLEIISTKYGGPLDFLNEKNSFLVNYDMEPIRASASGLFQYPYESNWARANADEAREILVSLLNGQSGKKNIRSKAQIGHENMGNTQWQEFMMSIRKYIS